MSTIPGQRRQSIISQIMAVLASGLWRVWRGLKYLFGALVALFFGLFLIFFTPFAIGNFVLSTPKVQAYRNLHPALPMCKEGLESGWTVLADANSDASASSERVDENAWVDPSNDENAAVAKNKDKPWSTLLRCALQRHVIPSRSGKKQIAYYLAFLEFKESGEPYSLAWNAENRDESISSEKLKDFLPNNYPELNRNEQIDALPITQLDVLRHHLINTPSNYVIVFAHGWRHDASIGDGNVADLRHYAAHAVRFLEQRCVTEGQYCDATVTAVYIGWRGARVNEASLKRYFGQSIGGFLGSFAAGATLFDRKPVSEQVAPGAISALRVLEKVALWPGASADDPKADSVNKMIVFGHSLGGNLFATGLQDDLTKSVRRHKHGETLPPVLGNLVVLINPAAEAAKWTAVQREVWSRIAYNTDSVTDINVVVESHAFFPSFQKPVIVSVTAALTFPSGGLRDGDCEWLNLKVGDHFVGERERIKKALEDQSGMFREDVDYDWATHDLFPAFKFDFRPLALWADRKVARIEGRLSPDKICNQNKADFLSRLKSEPLRTLESTPLRLLSRVARYFPFQNTNQELSHTIGNFDPLRPAGGVLVNKRLVPTAPFGTTHELFGFKRSEKHNSYASLADASIDCPPANHWLSRARQMQPPHGTNWDTRTLQECVHPATERVEQCPPAAQFLHGFNLAGQQPITRANDPFWNMRALDALSRHDGYRLSSFICAMNQLVMDDIVVPPSKPAGVAPVASEPGATKSDAAKPKASAGSDGAKSKSSESATTTPSRRKSSTQKLPSTRAPMPRSDATPPLPRPRP